MSKKFLWFIVLVILVAIAFGLVHFLKTNKPIPKPIEQVKVTGPKHEVIGKSVEGRDIEAYTYSNPSEPSDQSNLSATNTADSKQLLLVGGMHGGYEWNSVALAYQMMDYLTANPAQVPAGLHVTIIPSLNPDGLYKVLGKVGRITSADATSTLALSNPDGLGRFNAHDVDLNRNFDCKWKPESTWRAKVVSAGTAAFSEPEAAALRDFVQKIKPVGVVFWHSQANAVYASECENGILPQTLDIMTAYATAAGYPSVKSFDAYPVSGDSEGWLASIGIPAITVEMKTHETIEWEKNLAGVKALFGYYGKYGINI